MKENIFFTEKHQIGETNQPIKPIQKMKRGAKVDELKDIKDIASALRDYVKKKYPKYKFAVNIERFSGGQALRINWFQADFNPLVSEEAWGDTKEGKRYTINENYIESDEKLTPKAKSVLQDVVDFYEQYNYDFSEPQSDYYNVRFYTSVYIGTWSKPFEQVSGKPAKPTGAEQGAKKPKFDVGQAVRLGTIEYSRYVKSKNEYIYGVRTSTNKLLTIWESNISLKDNQEIPNEFTPNILEMLQVLEDGVPNSEVGSIPLLQDKKGDYWYVRSVSEKRAELKKATDGQKIDLTPSNIDKLDDFQILRYLPNASKKLKKIVVEWSETGEFDEGETFYTWNDFQQKAKTIDVSGNGYAKTKIFILWENNRALIDRVDFGNSDGDFDPNRDFLGDYIGNQTGAMYWSNFTSGERKNEALWKDTENDPSKEKPQEQPDMPQPETKYKVGDVFRRNLEGEEPPNTKITYTILSIGEEKTQYRIDYLDKQSSRLSTKSNEKILEEIRDDWWIKYEFSETPSEIENKAIAELDDELILLNELRKENFAQTNLEAQKEFRDELTELISARDIFTLGEFNFEKSIQTYFERISQPVNFESNEQEQINKRTELIANYVKTNAFKNWFGDWQNPKYPCSQAVKIDPISDKRVPLIVYHGTQNPEHFTRFKTDRFPIIYFAENPKYAQWFADLGNGKIFECFLDIRFPVDFRALELQEITWQQLSIFLKDTYGIILPTFPDLTEKRKVWQWIRFDGERNFTLLNAIKDANFDSMIHVENNPQQIDENGNEEITDAYMIFDTKRAKLVKYAYNVTSATTLLFLKKGGLLDLKREIKSL